MSCFASCLSDPDEVSAFFDSRAAKRYLSKLTPLERLVHREISAHPELVALRDQFQRVDESASGAIPPADLAPVLKLRPGAHCDLALDCFDANRDGEVSLFELVHGLARLAARGVADAPSFAFAACEGANERGFVTREEIAETFLKRRETREGFLYHTPAAKLDRAAFDHAAHTNYADILEPFERIWARLETLTGPAAETCAALKAQGHREFDASKRRGGRKKPTAEGVAFFAKGTDAREVDRGGEDRSETTGPGDPRGSSPETGARSGPVITPRLGRSIARANSRNASRRNINVVGETLFGAARTAEMRREARRASAAIEDERSALRRLTAGDSVKEDGLTAARARREAKLELAAMNRVARAAGMPTVASPPTRKKRMGLSQLASESSRRLLAYFGAGGERGKEKRRAAEEEAARVKKERRAFGGFPASFDGGPGGDEADADARYDPRYDTGERAVPLASKSKRWTFAASAKKLFFGAKDENETGKKSKSAAGPERAFEARRAPPRTRGRAAHA